jgi:DNA-binding GntR family transcriptional regulator
LGECLKAGDAAAAGEIIAHHVLTTGDEVVEQVRNWPKE